MATATEKVVEAQVEVDVTVPVGVPLGLQQLVPLNFVKIKQQWTTGSKKYAVTTVDGDRVFTAREDVSILGMMVGGNVCMDLYDENEHLVVTLRRPHSFGNPKMEVLVCGELASIVRKEATFFKLVLSINDANDQPVLRIKGLKSNWGNVDIKFEILAADKSCIGSITKRWAMARPGSLHVEFPSDLDTRFKVTIIGAAIFLDHILYVSQNA